MTGTALAMSFLIAGWTDSYAIAGATGAAFTLGFGISGPWRGRAADRGSATKLLVIMAAAYGVGTVLLVAMPTALPPSAWVVGVLLAFLCGVVQPPVGQIGRALWPRITEGVVLQAVYTIEATMQELLFVVGPMLAGLVIALAGGQAATAVCGALAVIGALTFAAALHRRGLGRPEAPPPDQRHSIGSLFSTPGILPLLVMTFCAIAPFTTTEIVLVAWARDRGEPELAGVMVAVWSLSSAVSGLIVGGLTGRPNLRMRFAWMAAGIMVIVPTLPPVAGDSVWLLGAMLTLGGITVAPAIAVMNLRIGELAPPDRRAEVFGWLMTGALAGSAAALPVAGWLLDHVGPAGAEACAAVFALAAAVLALRVPDAPRPLVGQNATP
ncbi:putative MFS family arabinose efflux permease [Herbihabitans rhizosphaerae]|uniref:Putative MFS family arabinose efflux permease n=1 Tax=Herbihabitans rhizosphaerae TaxID=1872711 RepID=A0A4Q7KM04_9PSEU|nr:MFS transporter [Herbihabitans rhizosphaerae]RZS36910.1 putative MFS family arabinose efflux permease [Herbihabitans rhizosphaerae]